MALPSGGASYNPNDTSWTRPVQDSKVVTASANQITDTFGEARAFRGIYVGTAGSVTVTHISGASVAYPNLAAGVIHPIGGTHITAATAVDLRVIW